MVTISTFVIHRFCKISNRAEKRRINSFVFPLLFFKMLAKQKRWTKISASYCSRRGTSSECLLLVGGFSAGCSDLRLLSGDASSVCNFNIGFAARLVVVCYLLCSAEFPNSAASIQREFATRIYRFATKGYVRFFSAVGILASLRQQATIGRAVNSAERVVR